MIDEIDVNLEEKLKNLDFILKKDLFDNDNLNKSSDINFKIATLERKKIQVIKIAVHSQKIAIKLLVYL